MLDHCWQCECTSKLMTWGSANGAPSAPNIMIPAAVGAGGFQVLNQVEEGVVSSADSTTRGHSGCCVLSPGSCPPVLGLPERMKLAR